MQMLSPHTISQNRLYPASPLDPKAPSSFHSFRSLLTTRPDIRRIEALPENYSFSQEIDLLTDQLCNRLPFRRFFPASGNLVRMAKLYSASIELIHAEMKAYSDFAYAISRARFTLKNYHDAEIFYHVFDDLASAEAWQDLPDYVRQNKDGSLALKADILALPSAEIYALLAESCRDLARNVYELFFAAVSDLNTRNEIGKIRWVKPDVCELNFVLYPMLIQGIGLSKSKRRKLKQEVKTYGRTQEFRTLFEETTNQNIRIQRFATSCTSTMVGVRCHRLPAPLVPKPGRLVPLFDTLPASLAPLAYVIDGLRTYHAGRERQLGVDEMANVTTSKHVFWEKKRVHCDPCLAIGPVAGPTTVLAAWDYDDLGGEDEYFSEARRLRRERLKRWTGYSLCEDVFDFFANR